MKNCSSRWLEERSYHFTQSNQLANLLVFLLEDKRPSTFTSLLKPLLKLEAITKSSGNLHKRRWLTVFAITVITH